MQNQTGFNLDESMTRWRETMASQPGLSAEKVRELESHLLDSIADLQQRGLNEQESFWLACWRFGAAQDVAKEIIKADPSRIWAERVLWMVFGVLVMNCFVVSLSVPIGSLFPRSTWRWSGVVVLAGAYLLMTGIAIGLARGWFSGRLLALVKRYQTRDLFPLLMMALGGIPIFYWGLQLWQRVFLFPFYGPAFGALNVEVVFNLGLPVLLCGLAIYLRRRLLDGEYKTV